MTPDQIAAHFVYWLFTHWYMWAAAWGVTLLGLMFVPSRKIGDKK